MISWSNLCCRVEFSASSLVAMKYSRPTSLSLVIVWCLHLICTSTIAEYVETVAFSEFSTGNPRISLYKERASTIRKSRLWVCPSMVKARVIPLIELMLLPVNPMSGIVRGSMFVRDSCCASRVNKDSFDSAIVDIEGDD